ncbi:MULTISPECIES: exopolyphosphatase [unclassified Listeria]|uniref:Ppx/GppA phosphatase family protein n=1 Tax=unclassified Listeria TaxID=2642072 RepID=UPI000B58CFBE|nr:MULTISPECIES: exopolyphosphatase [unclassified Listeria]
MGTNWFAAITVGSQNVILKIMDMRKQTVLEYIKAEVSIGTDIFNGGKIELETVEATSVALSGFVNIMREYAIEDSLAVAVSAIQEASNAEYVKEQIRLRTGLELEWLSNSEERFLHSQAAANATKNFSELIQEGTMLIDIGTGSIQLTVYDEGNFMFSRNIKLGPLRVRELLSELKERTSNFADLLEDFIFSKIRDYAQFAPKDVAYKHFILIGTDLLFFKRAFVEKAEDKITEAYFAALYAHILETPEKVLAKKYELSFDSISQLLPSAMLLKELLKVTQASEILLSDAELVDGILVEEMIRQKKLTLSHDFSKDIVMSARNIAVRYKTDRKHAEAVEKFALHLFDQLKPIHGLTKRERLLLQIAAILQDIGSYIDMNNHYAHSEYIILATEILGLSAEELQMVGAIARYHSTETPSLNLHHFEKLPIENRLTTAKLTAILRLADSLDDSHQQKVTKISLSLKKEHVLISVWADDDLMLEKWTFNEKAGFFEEVYGIKAHLKEKGEQK